MDMEESIMDLVMEVSFMDRILEMLLLQGIMVASTGRDKRGGRSIAKSCLTTREDHWCR
jgi:hypothetical protein